MTDVEAVHARRWWTLGVLCLGLLIVFVLRFLPRHIAQHGAVRGPLEAAEDMAALGLAGTPPVPADTAEHHGATAAVSSASRVP